MTPTLIQNIRTKNQWFGVVLQNHPHSYTVQMICTKDGRPFSKREIREVNHTWCRIVTQLPSRYAHLSQKPSEKPKKCRKTVSEGFLPFGAGDAKLRQLRRSGKYPFLYALDYLRYQCCSEQPLTKEQAYDMVYSLCFTIYDREAGTLDWDREMVVKFAERRIEWLVGGMHDNGDE
jgi:hypothetical protein